MRHRASAVAAASIVATMLAGSPAMAGQDPSALSKATLAYSVSSITCTLATPGGSSNVPCDTPQWSVTLQPGWSATMAVTYDYHYTDDGLPINGWLIQPSTGGLRPVSFESAGLYVNSYPACGRGPCTPLAPALSGNVGLVPAFEFDNSVADDISGSRTLNLTASWSEQDGTAWTGSFGYMEAGAFVNSVPEPAMWALMALPLAAGMLVLRRRGLRDTRPS